MSINIPPFKADVVGSYLRPEYLHKARSDYANGTISSHELKKIEDKAIIELVEKQKKAGLHVITDGEFRRSWWHLDFMWGLNGVEKAYLSKGYSFDSIETRPETARLTGKISGNSHPFIEHFSFLLKFAEDNIVPRLTIPAPAQFFKELYRPENLDSTNATYPSKDELINDIVIAYQEFIKELYLIGCRNLQLDDCTWGMMVDSRYHNSGIAESESVNSCSCHSDHTVISNDINSLAETLVYLNNEAIKNAPSDLVLTTHVCRGNYRSTWAASGGYGPIAEILFGRENVSAYYLEFDTDRAGDFSPLSYVSGNKKVVLGLISSKIGELEDKQKVIERIYEASKFIPLDRLCLSTQCGFASTEEGNALTEEQQWDKIALVKEIAQEVWKD
ncbi:5-methyltetrahydropteroyltriglutamate--homocysteine S-methyltransferase [Proteus mirabilis]|uniref:5-methyltetrahydropteroyltriglutamate-- homocysteine S-methyltransferase n=1 Tax=Proteus TaxID=583 RepID=UPI0023F9E238|nr:5-methyltetrahydropteroyltriglutamate--homocysteine S-methyltransferase [Proteus mirabilis]MDF7211059.1 5-methyltetrahydropteroyltriglutamate--homocysteine S-methyltransferase [Proteus mirabilis]MDF7238440.1 5-methyltetrahydropteroyltriglutamate--homocysteine S-methyltransferase [Proteus mirabilis]MDF7394698.1 5-methyltetrahydropteroyltriglutamate--homocysteine S-methyltransferase [Proteus mirabilis]